LSFAVLSNYAARVNFTTPVRGWGYTIGFVKNSLWNKKSLEDILPKRRCQMTAKHLTFGSLFSGI